MNQSIHNTSRFLLLQVLVVLSVLLNLSGLFITILGPDGTLYATIAKTMVLRNNYIELFARGTDWLDKPHLPFWITAVFFKIFGLTTWAYKLPGILFLFMGAWYTYLFAKKLYNKQVALWAVIILLTAQHTIMSNTDVRAEGYLTGCIIAAVYYYNKVIADKRFLTLLWGSLFAALAVMTKGMFALIPVAGAIAGGLIIQKRWKDLFNIRWLIAALVMLLFILPEIYCLYYQFDLHPEKVVFGQQNVSGIKFFFWDSQFGRFFNTGPIKGSGDIFFFLHTTLWAFLPWSIILYCALARQLKNLFTVDTAGLEWFSFPGAILTFLLFSLSKFQLPHYINIVFPFFAVITAGYIFKVRGAAEKNILISQHTLLAIVSLSPALIYFVYSPVLNWFPLTVITLGVLSVYLLPARFARSKKEKLIIRTVLAASVVNLFFNLYFYPSLLTYQSGSEAAFFANKYYKDLPVVQVNGYYSPLEFYTSQRVYTSDSSLTNMPQKPYLAYVATTDLPLFQSKNIQFTPVQKFEDFRISRMNFRFINKTTRKKAVSEYQLLLVQ